MVAAAAKNKKKQPSIPLQDLDIPQLNTSSNPQTKVQKKGKKKGKKFAESSDDLHHILNKVAYELDDRIKSKLQVAHEREAAMGSSIASTESAPLKKETKKKDTKKDKKNAK
ncbi:ribosome biogenesis protein Loc1 [Schizosaccharomyces osmophilus]|uniref:Ribosome biogenesis protein Loc1 n=1 Tax=Schizosaccharomyces osmophilus TaxID=2545709 RepID=A0AAF0AUC3_9SCHI|nr:ribosome biogenesis protein Loc1 [Schizosaccharomyces osmophilus]WBW71223.1 ribosome biogenesis protein Loc1 [Schizosaccharomyces osmophilus]